MGKKKSLKIQIKSEQEWEYIDEEKETSSDVMENDQSRSSLAPPTGQATVSRRRQAKVLKKKARFTPEELVIVAEELSTHNKLLFSVQHDPAKAQRKDTKWADILKRVNAQGVTSRTIADIKKRWHDLRRAARKKLLKIRREEAKAEGGSPSERTRLTRLEKMAAKTMTPKMIYSVSRREDTLDIEEEEEPPSAQCSPMVEELEEDPYETQPEAYPLLNVQVGTSEEVQIKSEDEWEYVEQQRELYKDVMDNCQTESSWAPPTEQASVSSRWQVKAQKRKARFTPEELAIVAEELSTHNNLLFRAQHNVAGIQRKAAKWADILRRVNAMGITHRTIVDIKKKWHELRRATKKKLLQIRREAQEMGPEETRLTRFEEMAARTMTPQMIYGLSEGMDILETEEELPRLERPQLGQRLEEEPCGMRQALSSEQDESPQQVEKRSCQSALKRIPKVPTTGHILTLEDTEIQVSETATPTVEQATSRRPPISPPRGNRTEARAGHQDQLAHQISLLVKTIHEHNDLLRGHHRYGPSMERRMARLENAVKSMVRTNHILIQTQSRHTQEVGNLAQATWQLVEQLVASRPGTVPSTIHQHFASTTSASILPPT
ncbi:uncharacterized protein LOC142466933 isoform X2 [Ascaphus truei]|uniref:uncharacterized protein LOC142466933 isoform X2 n=1 Tax=Ascaphus truei TaxID=8439 RepID=UPI003F5A4CDE